MKSWTISLANAAQETFSANNHDLVRIEAFMDEPSLALDHASLQNFAKITPQYPGIRAPIPVPIATAWLATLAPMLNSVFGRATHGWEMQAWYSLVTTPPRDLIPLQRFPHVDGTDPQQVAMMLYLHRTDHGGTAFFRHRSTGFEALTDETFPQYRAALEQDVRHHGLPAAGYVTDGEPLFEKTYASEGRFNQAIFYRGNLLHSGVIADGSDLSSDPREGRLTINAFFRPSDAPKEGSGH